MLDGLLAQWSSIYNRIMNFSDSNNSISLLASQTQIADLSLPSTSTTAATTTGWTVTKVWGDGDDDMAKSLQDILNRMTSRSILSDVLYRPILAAIIAAVTFAIQRKIRYPIDTAAVSWKDALGVALIGACVHQEWMLEAIVLTAAYVAWSFLADRPLNAGGKTPDFQTFLASLRPATDNDPTTKTSTEESPSATTNEATTTTPTSTDVPPPTDQSPESATLSQFEAQLGLPEREPEKDCIVCWTSDETPLRLPCSHLVCSSCLYRLRDSSRYTCPYCSTALFNLKSNKKALLHQAAVAASAAHLAICLVEAALKIAQRQYFGALSMLSLNLPSALSALYIQSRIRVRGEEEFFSAVTEGSLTFQLVMSLYLAHARYGGVPDVDTAIFLDGKWERYRTDEFFAVRGMMCWLAPGLAARFVTCD